MDNTFNIEYFTNKAKECIDFAYAEVMEIINNKPSNGKRIETCYLNASYYIAQFNLCSNIVAMMNDCGSVFTELCNYAKDKSKIIIEALDRLYYKEKRGF